MSEVKYMPNLDDEEENVVTVSFTDVSKYTVSYTEPLQNISSNSDFNDYIFNKKDNPSKWRRLVKWLKNLW